MCEFEFHSWRGVLDTTLCDTDYKLLVAGRGFSRHQRKNTGKISPTMQKYKETSLYYTKRHNKLRDLPVILSETKLIKFQTSKIFIFLKP
jgi:hypothetical protein